MLIQEILEDKEFEKVTINVYFFSSAILDPFEFFAYKKKIIGSHTHTGSLFKISFEEELPKKLLGKLAWGRSEEFIIGYISKYLPRVNEELLNQRYSTGHLLIKTFTTLDISNVDINIHSSKEGNVILNWPQMINNIPPARQLAPQFKNESYIKNFIDASHAYLSGNHDECIKKCITSVENFFNKNNLTCKKIINPDGSQKSKFESIVLTFIYSEFIGKKIVANNLIFLYKLRNKIVHADLRIRHENAWISKKAIGTLNYLYQFLNKDPETKDYISFLAGQFLMLDKFTQGENLDHIRQREENSQEITPDQIIDSDEKMNDFMFDGLEIKEVEKSILLR